MLWRERAALAFATFGADAIQLRRSHAVTIVEAISVAVNIIVFLLVSYSLQVTPISLSESSF